LRLEKRSVYRGDNRKEETQKKSQYKRTTKNHTVPRLATRGKHDTNPSKDAGRLYKPERRLGGIPRRDRQKIFKFFAKSFTWQKSPLLSGE
jgi:hypothetical protein